MQSPLTPQRGRIESNPREYTHMGPSANLPHERGFSDGNSSKTPKNRPEIHSRFLTVHHSCIFHFSLISNMRDNRKTRDKYER